MPNQYTIRKAKDAAKKEKARSSNAPESEVKPEEIKSFQAKLHESMRLLNVSLEGLSLRIEITGAQGSEKSRLAHRIVQILNEEEHRTVRLLDGDNLQFPVSEPNQKHSLPVTAIVEVRQ